MRRASMRVALTALTALLVSCGGGGSSAGTSSSWTSGVFRPSSSFAAQCAAPRRGMDPYTGRAYADVQGSVLTENNWLRSWTNELYLWYSEVVDQDPALFSSTALYFDVLKTSAVTASGNPKDKFHFTYATSTWEALSQAGTQAGYGLQFAVVVSQPPRQVVVAYTEPNTSTPAFTANLGRGAQVLAVDGVDLVNDGTQAGVDTLNAGLFPAGAGETHTFSILDYGADAPRTVTMVSADVTSTPVQHVETLTTPTGKIGYMLFNDHLATSEAQLISAFTTLRDAAVDDLVLDIRYNGGGYLDIASEVAYMIAGPGPTTGQTFELTQFNAKHPTIDPVTGQGIVPVPFHATAQGFSATAGQALPTLNLARVYLLTGPNTCSASESIINSLQGVNVQVIQIGSTTCGKPYGFYPQDNCGTTYFSIEFRGVNAKAFGDYSDGFSPANTASNAGVLVPGCSVADDYGHALGDSAEGRLAAALSYRDTGSCPVPATGAAQIFRQGTVLRADGLLIRPPWRENRILRPPSQP